MKKIFFFAVMATATLFISCADDSSINNVDDTSMDLLKTVKYVPTKDAYDNNAPGSTKSVQYFEDNKVIADTTFDISGNIVIRASHTYTDTTHIKEVWVNGVLSERMTNFFDSENRIIERRYIDYVYGNEGVRKTFYDTGSIMEMSYDPDTDQPTYQNPIMWHTNSLGLIRQLENPIEDGNDEIIYEADKLTQWNFFHLNSFGVLNTATVNLEYYDVSMPSNQIKTITELNNLFLLAQDYRIESCENNNYHLMRYVYTSTSDPSPTFVNFEKTFNELGYVTYSKAEGTIYESVRDSETFYYYQ